MDAWGASFAAAGLGDLALYEGRFSDAVRILEQGAAADLASKNTDSAAMKFAALGLRAPGARAESRRRSRPPTRRSQNSTAVPIRFLTARIFVEAGAIAKGQPARRRACVRARGGAAGLRQRSSKARSR